MTRCRRVVLVGLAVFALGGCVWRSVGFDSARTGSSPIEHALGLLGPTNVTQLAPAWTASTGTSPNHALFQDPVVDFDHVYVEGFGGLFAFDAGTGALLWNAPLPVAVSGMFPATSAASPSGMGVTR